MRLKQRCFCPYLRISFYESDEELHVRVARFAFGNSKTGSFRTVYHHRLLSNSISLHLRQDKGIFAKIARHIFFFFFFSLQLKYFQRYITYLYFRLSQASNYGAIEKTAQDSQPSVALYSKTKTNMFRDDVTYSIS